MTVNHGQQKALSQPLVSVGLPVFNGERYLEEALASIVSQTHANLEVIVADNASPDRTPEICRAYADADPRVRYIRNSRNLGGARNHNLVFEQSRGRYFKLAAHDDVIAPTFIERCTKELESHPDAVLAWSKITHIDGEGTPFEVDIDQSLEKTSALDPVKRFATVVGVRNRAIPVFGVIRRDAVRRGELLGPWVGSDRVLLAELALAGPWRQVPEYLFYRREHQMTSTTAFPNEWQRLEWWFGPGGADRLSFPTWRRLVELVRTIRENPMSTTQRARAYLALARWMGLPFRSPHALRLLTDPFMAAWVFSRRRLHRPSLG